MVNPFYKKSYKHITFFAERQIRKMKKSERINRLNRKYFQDESGEIDLVAHSINCYENILYHALKDYKVDYKLAFCNDINLRVGVGKDIILTKNHIDVHDDLFIVNSHSPSSDLACTLIEKLVDSGKIVAVNTMFDMLPPYFWFGSQEKKGKSNTHLCTIVGYDSNNFFFTDNPSMLVKERMKTYPGNDTIGVIEKSIMEKAFQYYCQIYEISINVNALRSIDKFEETRVAILQNYDMCSYYDTCNNSVTYIGKSALQKFIWALENDLILNELTKDFFFVYLMYSSRKIFKWCLEKKRNEYINSNVVLECLDTTIKEWEILYYIILRHVLSPRANIKDVLIKKITRIIFLEDILMGRLSKCNLR